MTEEEADTLGLELTTGSRAHLPDPTTRGFVLFYIQGLRVVNMDDTILLGSPLGNLRCVSVIASLACYPLDDVLPQDLAIP